MKLDNTVYSSLALVSRRESGSEPCLKAGNVFPDCGGSDVERKYTVQGDIVGGQSSQFCLQSCQALLLAATCTVVLSATFGTEEI